MRVTSNLAQLPDFQRTVITIGSFDGVHEGHRHILRQVRDLARSVGGESVVITFDPHPRTVLRPDDEHFRLLTTTAEKTRLIAQNGIDHTVVVPFDAAFAQLSAKQYVEEFLLEKFHPYTIVIGYDHHFGHDREGNFDFLKKYANAGHFDLVEIPAQVVDDLAVSSSKIRKAIENQDLTLANRLLGHPFTLSGRVVMGNQVGRTIGFPTANLDLGDRYKLVPPEGIYAAVVAPPSPPVGGEPASGQMSSAALAEESGSAALAEDQPATQERSAFPPAGGARGGLLYIGRRPVFEGQSELRIEVHLLDFDGDLYGQELEIEVLDFIRGDRKIDGLAALQAQIEADKQQIVQRLAELRPSVTAPLPTATTSQPTTSDVAVVILNYNTRAQLAQYLPSVVAHSGDARIVVADNGSPDDSVAFLQAHYPQVELIVLPQNYGFAEGYNQALEQYWQRTDRPKFYVLLNSDVEVTPGWLDPIVAAMRRDPAIGVAQPKILAELRRERFEHAGASGGWIDALGYPFCRGRIFNHVEADTGQYNDAQACFWASGAAFFVRAELYHGLGGFDGDYFAHNEEIDFCWRAQRAGYSVWCFPESRVYHLGGGTLDYESPRKAYLNFRNSLFTLLKNESVGKLLWLIPARLLLDGVAALMYASKKQFKMIGAILEAHQSFYKMFGMMRRKRSEVTQAIENQRIGPESKRVGVYWGSVVFAHYLRRIKEFSKLPS